MKLLLVGQKLPETETPADDGMQKKGGQTEYSATSAYLTSDNKQVINLCFNLKMIRKFED